MITLVSISRLRRYGHQSCYPVESDHMSGPTSLNCQHYQLLSGFYHLDQLNWLKPVQMICILFYFEKPFYYQFIWLKSFQSNSAIYTIWIKLLHLNHQCITLTDCINTSGNQKKSSHDGLLFYVVTFSVFSRTKLNITTYKNTKPPKIVKCLSFNTGNVYQTLVMFTVCLERAFSFETNDALQLVNLVQYQQKNCT